VLRHSVQLGWQIGGRLLPQDRSFFHGRNPEVQQMAPITLNDLGDETRDEDADRLAAGSKLVDAL